MGEELFYSSGLLQQEESFLSFDVNVHSDESQVLARCQTGLGRIHHET